MDKEPPSGPYGALLTQLGGFRELNERETLFTRRVTFFQLAAEWDAWISFRSNDFGKDEELALQLYVMLTAKSWRVFYAPICLPGSRRTNACVCLWGVAPLTPRAESTRKNQKQHEGVGGEVLARVRKLGNCGPHNFAPLI